MPVDLTNTINATRDYTLDHPLCHEAGFGHISRNHHFDFEVGDATPKARLVVRRIAGTLLFLAKETKENLPNAVLHAPQVREAVRQGFLEISNHRPEPKGAQASASGASVASAPAEPVTEPARRRRGEPVPG